MTSSGQAAAASGGGGGGGDGLAEQVSARIERACGGEDTADEEGAAQHRFTFDREPSIFDDVGGVQAWKRLNEQLKAGRLGA